MCWSNHYIHQHQDVDLVDVDFLQLMTTLLETRLMGTTTNFLGRSFKQPRTSLF